MNKILHVVVDDLKDQIRGSDVDEAIVQCLRGLKIEIWNWRRMNISSELIRKVAGSSVKEVYLYCSGNNAVLRSWSEKRGLAQLTQVCSVSRKTKSTVLMISLA